MYKRLVPTVLALLVALASHAVDLQIEKDHISGRVFISSTNHGVAGLSVRLIAPQAMRQPVRVTITDDDGLFAFSGLTVGRYLLAIYRGTELLYRKEIDNRVSQRFTVSLRPVPASPD